MSRHKKIFIALAVLVFVAAGIAGYFVPRRIAEKREETREAAFVPSTLPDDLVAPFAADFSTFSAATEAKPMPDAPFLDLAGRQVRFADFQGRPTLVNFWASWCAPCVVELPALEKLEKHYKGRLNVVAVAVSETRSREELAKFLESRLIGPFAAHLDETDTLMEALKLDGLPTSVIVDENGMILYRLEGDADWTSEAARGFFDALLLRKS